MQTSKHRIILTEEIDYLDQTRSISSIVKSDSAGSGDDTTDAIGLLQSLLLPGELLRLAKRLEQAKRSGNNILVGVEFTHGHARKIVYNESEILDRE